MFKNALISVSDKTGLAEFLRPYAEMGLRIVSTGGTAQHLSDQGFQVIDVSEQTGFPEVMGGRVKTLHPNIHMAILSRQSHPEDLELLKAHNLEAFDLVICNLYPFEAAVSAGVVGEALIEKIDIGGPSLLRAAAKNFSRVTVVCDPSDYSWIQQRSEISLTDRKFLASKVFSHTSSYDSLVARSLDDAWGSDISIGGHKIMDLRYGENPQQKAAWYRNLADAEGLHSAQVIQGKALSYNNILDLDAASGLVRMFSVPAAVAVKHNNPCGAAIDENFFKALEKTLSSDPVSVFGGIIAVNREIGAAEAEILNQLFLECVVAPSYSKEALQIFSKKKNLRILTWPALMKTKKPAIDFKSVCGGFVLQSYDQVTEGTEHWSSSAEIPATVKKDLAFAEKVCLFLKSNAIALVKNGQTMGLGMGQVNRVDAVAHAIERMEKHFGPQSDVVLASDAFFPFADSIEKAAQHGIKWIIQPGGSIKDTEVLQSADKLKVKMILTGERHFRH